MSRLSQWQPYNRPVQSGLVDGQYLNASFTMLAAGPPRLANIGGISFAGTGLESQAADKIVFPIGIVQNYNLSNNRQFSRIFEIGSERSFWISGRTMGQIGLSRIVYYGPSLLRALYAYYEDLIAPTLIPSVVGANNLGAQTVSNAHNVKIPPGYENLFLNLASDLFSQPIGLMMYFRDSNEETFGSVYAEAGVIPNHSLSTDAQGTVIQENTTVQYERLVPVAVSAVNLIGLNAADNEILGL